MEARGLHGETPLHLASLEGNLEAGRCLLDHGADINPPSYRKLVPVCAAAIKGHAEFVQMLLERGAAMDVRLGMDAEGTPLTPAVKLRKIEIVRLLLENGEYAKNCDRLDKYPSESVSLHIRQEVQELVSEYGAESVE